MDWRPSLGSLEKGFLSFKSGLFVNLGHVFLAQPRYGQNRVKSGQMPGFEVKHKKNENVVSQEMSHVDDMIHV